MQTYDLVVVGGGLTGVAAAVAAARQGLDVLLCEQSGFLGGALGNCLINPFMNNGTNLVVDGEKTRVELSQGIFAEIQQELIRLGAQQGNMFHEEYMKIVLDRMAIQAGVHVLLHVTLCDVEKEGETLRSVTVVGKSGKIRLGARFRVANVDMEKFRANRDKITPLYQKLQKEGKIRNPREDVLMFFHPVKNVVHFNTTRVIKLNPVDPFDLTKAEMEAREQMLEMFEMLKNNIPGFENADITMSGPQIGVRESRMIIGEHVLTVEELKACTRFPDAIAAGNYDVDIHSPDGAGTSHYYFKEGEYYTIPYRSLLPKEADNLLVAGRCISSTHEAQASYRIMPIVTTLGEAAGVAASVACKAGVNVKEADVGRIQQVLRENGAFLGI